MPFPPQLQQVPPIGVPAGERMSSAWRVWLSSLAVDADAATAAAHLYGELSDEGRDAWLDALEEDTPRLQVPAIAAYGPLFSVEQDPVRLVRMRKAVKHVPAPGGCIRRALHGSLPNGVNVAVLVMPLYLQFVRVLAFRFQPGKGFDWARQHPFSLDGDAPRVADEIEGVKLNRSCAVAVIDALAHAVLAEKRNGGQAPVLLHRYAELFSARVHDEADEIVAG